MFMAITTLFYSLSPLLVAASGVSKSPFLFAGLMQLGGLLGYLALLGLRYHSLLADREVRAAIKRHLLDLRGAGPLFVLGTLSGLDYVLFIWSTQFIDISVSTVLFELWPLFSIPLTAVLTGHEGRYRKVNFSFVLLLGGALGGTALVIASQSGHLIVGGLASRIDLVVGVVLGILSAFTVALAVCLFRWSEDLVELFPESLKTAGSLFRLEVFSVAVSIILADFFCVSLSLGVGLVVGEVLGAVQVGVALVGGFFLYMVGSVFWRAANFITYNLGVNALGSFAPLGALGWLWLYSRTNLSGHDVVLVLERPDFLVAGVVLVVVFNVMLNVEMGGIWAVFRRLRSAFGFLKG